MHSAIVHTPSNEEEVPEEEDKVEMEIESPPELVPTDTEPYSSSFTESVIAGRLIRIKECHNLPQVVVDYVVELIQAICEDLSTKAQSSIQSCGKRIGINNDFLQDVLEIFQASKIPLSSLETAYKQQSYIVKNIPYVVRFMSG